MLDFVCSIPLRWPVGQQWPCKGLAIDPAGRVWIGDGREVQDESAGLFALSDEPITLGKPLTMGGPIDLIVQLRRSMVESFSLTGFAFDDDGLMHVCGRRFYNVSGLDIPARFTVDMASGYVTGPFSVPGMHSLAIAGFVTRGLNSGTMTTGGQVHQAQAFQSQGPSAITYGSVTRSLMLTHVVYPKECSVGWDKAEQIMYRQVWNQKARYATRMPGMTPADEWDAASWIGNDLWIFGRQGRGRPYYGEPGGPDDPLGQGATRLKPNKGHHSDPYEHRMLIFTEDELTRDCHPWERLPQSHKVPMALGGAIAGAAYHAETSMLFLLHSRAEDGSSPPHIRQYFVPFRHS